MIPLLITLAAVAYAAADLFAARFIYGHIRAWLIDDYGSGPNHRDPLTVYEKDRFSLMALSVVLAIIWPAAIACWLLRIGGVRLARFLDGTPVKSRYERGGTS